MHAYQVAHRAEARVLAHLNVHRSFSIDYTTNVLPLPMALDGTSIPQTPSTRSKALNYHAELSDAYALSLLAETPLTASHLRPFRAGKRHTWVFEWMLLTMGPRLTLLCAEDPL